MIDPVLYWNGIALEVHRRDFNGDRVMPEVAGPTRASRALAMVHLAMHDAWMAYKPGAKTYLDAGELPRQPAASASREAAVGAAAFTVLGTLFTRPQTYLDEEMRAFEHHLSSGQSAADIAAGKQFGVDIAQAVLKKRENDGSGVCTAYIPGKDEGHHRQDPYHPDQGFLDPHWGCVGKFYVGTQEVEREDPPGFTGFCGNANLPQYDFNNQRYKTDFDEVRKFGAAYSSDRKYDQTVQGVFWAYDGARGIGTPPRLYNQCVRTIALDKKLSVDDSARLFALINVAMADAGIIAWYEKYRYSLWRPVIGIREAGPAYGPMAGGSGGLEPDPFWRPYGSPASNRPGIPNFTPNFPAYPSGHATFGTACFEVVRTFFGGEDVSWTQTSDELDGRTIDPDGSVRSLHRRPLTLARAIRENLDSRVFLGVHWRFDGDRGKEIGEAIAKTLADRDVLHLSTKARSTPAQASEA